jgi:hypothetical protein
MSMVKIGSVAKPPAMSAAKPKSDGWKAGEKRDGTTGKTSTRGFAGAAELLEGSPTPPPGESKKDLEGNPADSSGRAGALQPKRGPPPAPAVQSGSAGGKTDPK